MRIKIPEFKKPEFLIETEKKFKKIGDVLRDKGVVRFTLSVKLYRDGLSEPKTIALQGERSADGGWNARFPKDQHVGALQSPETLKGKLASIEKQVREYIVENALDARWKELDASIKEALQSGLSVEDLEYPSEVPIDAVLALSYEAHFCAPVMATAYAIEGAEALAKNDLDRASHCVDRGLYWSNPEMFIPNPRDRFTERASEGGKGKALGHEPVRDKVTELLMKLAPEEGWASTTAAIEAVADELNDNHASFVEECGLQTENLPRTIAGWVQVDPDRFPYRIKSEP
jgi:hypothetical protein